MRTTGSFNRSSGRSSHRCSMSCSMAMRRRQTRSAPCSSWPIGAEGTSRAGPSYRAADPHATLARGLEVIEQTRTDSTELVARKGTEHEQRYLESLIARQLDVVTIPSSSDGAASTSEAAAATEAAMRAGADIIYQAALADAGWRG